MLIWILIRSTLSPSHSHSWRSTFNPPTGMHLSFSLILVFVKLGAVFPMGQDGPLFCCCCWWTGSQGIQTERKGLYIHFLRVFNWVFVGGEHSGWDAGSSRGFFGSFLLLDRSQKLCSLSWCKSTSQPALGFSCSQHSSVCLNRWKCNNA